MKKTAVRLGLAAMIAGSIMGSAPHAFASGGGDEVIGRCSGSSTSTLKAKLDNGQIEIEFEVDQNVSGQTWNVLIRDNDTVVFRGMRVTQDPSGSFEVRRLTENQAGTDMIVAKAKNPSTGEVCKASTSV